MNPTSGTHAANAVQADIMHSLTEQHARELLAGAESVAT